MSRKIGACAAVAALAFAAQSAFAAVPAGEAAKLGNELTAVGAEKAGNADGTIPAYTGGIATPPAGYQVGQFHADPYAADQPLFTIDRSNVNDHADKLSEGQKAMIAKYPSFKMIVYPTRRSAAFSPRINEYTAQNATTCTLVADGEGVQNCAEGFPFPIPKNGYEAIWNHKLKYKGIANTRWSNQIPVTASGQYTVVRLRDESLGLYYKPGNTSENINNILIYFFQVVEGPARLAGQVLLVHETLNQAAAPRQAWIYNPGQRRVRRAPNVAYDNPGTASDGLRTNDMFDMFNGATDRHELKLVGKREMYVPYNSYKVHSGSVKVKDMIKPGHINPDLLRYELHRVWVVEATLKPGKRHINPRRTFYLDEDSFQILVLDHYDTNGKLWRYSEAPSIQYWEAPTFWSTLETHHDLQSGRYLPVLVDNEETPPDFGFVTSPNEFSPQSLRKRGIR